jgi:hypothetical protein
VTILGGDPEPVDLPTLRGVLSDDLGALGAARRAAPATIAGSPHGMAPADVLDWVALATGALLGAPIAGTAYRSLDGTEHVITDLDDLRARYGAMLGIGVQRRIDATAAWHSVRTATTAEDAIAAYLAYADAP